MEECANVACFSHSHFSKIFHETTALSFKEFLNHVRVEKACDILENTYIPITEIAFMVGFSSESYFGYVFRRIKKISPSNYRKKRKKVLS